MNKHERKPKPWLPPPELDKALKWYCQVRQKCNHVCDPSVVDFRVFSAAQMKIR